jgi:hypothetical protein
MKNFKNKLSNAIYKGLCVVILCTSCTSSNDFQKGKKQLEQQGYTNVENTGWAAFCCSDEDTFSTGFKAKDKQGRTVKGCFCGGVLKGVTIRFE